MFVLDPIGIIIIIFVLFAWSRVILRFKDHAISLKEFIIWSIIWIIVMILTIFRGLLGFLKYFTTLERPIDIIVVASIILIFYLMFRIYVKIDHTDQQITKIVREIAISKTISKKGNNKNEIIPRL